MVPLQTKTMLKRLVFFGALVVGAAVLTSCISVLRYVSDSGVTFERVASRRADDPLSWTMDLSWHDSIAGWVRLSQRKLNEQRARRTVPWNEINRKFI